MPASFSQRSMAATAVCTAARGIATVSTCKDVSQGNQCPIAPGERIAGEAGQEIGDVAAAEGRGLACSRACVRAMPRITSSSDGARVLKS
jgi:hypothetical protein